MLSPVAKDVVGDALWAAMVVWWVGVAAPCGRPVIRWGVALGVCFAVELGQLYHGEAVDAVRRTMLGHLVLGSGFDPRDFVAYAGGVLAAAGVEGAFLRARRGETR